MSTTTPEPTWTVHADGIPTDAAVQSLARLLLLDSLADDAESIEVEDD